MASAGDGAAASVTAKAVAPKILFISRFKVRSPLVQSRTAYADEHTKAQRVPVFFTVSIQWLIYFEAARWTAAVKSPDSAEKAWIFRLVAGPRAQPASHREGLTAKQFYAMPATRNVTRDLLLREFQCVIEEHSLSSRNAILPVAPGHRKPASGATIVRNVCAILSRDAIGAKIRRNK